MPGKIKKGGKVYKYKSEDSEKIIKGKEIASKGDKPTEKRQTIIYKDVKKGEIKKTKSKGYVGLPTVNKKAGLKETYKEVIKGGKNKKYTVDDEGFRKDKDGNSPALMKGSPYMMYGKEMSPMTMKGESPLAKYGSSKKYSKSPLNKNGGDKKKVLDVMGNPYDRTGNTYEDYAMQYGATPTKREARKYERKVKKGKI